MSRYNYFDDDPSEREWVERLMSGDSNNDNAPSSTGTPDAIKQLAGKTIKTVKELAHNNPLKEIITLPDITSFALRLTAFVLFLVAIGVFILAFSHSISSQNKKNERFYTDAGKVCTDYLTDFGVAKWESLKSDEYGDSMTRLTGLCYARQMDFDNDGNDELMLCYSNRSIYTLEVWGYKGKEFAKLYSEEANKTNDVKDGSWIAFYHKNNKYYICKTTPDEPTVVKMYALKGDTFKEQDSCDYDYKNNIYSVNGKINAQDFETIKLSVIKSSKADQIIDIVTANIDSFHTVSISEISAQKTEADLKADAYYKIVEGRNEKYGKAKLVEDKGEPYIDGLGVVDLIDFDGDGNEELLLVYRKMIKESAENYYTGERIIIEKPTYCIEVYNWNGSVATKKFSNDSISNYLNDSSVNYVILKNGKNTVDICSNTYSYRDEYNYTAASRIYSYKDSNFTSTFSAREEVSYGYKSYYINGEYAYRSSFDNTAFKVPKFLNDDADYDKTQYRMLYLSGKNVSGFDETINDTVKTIESLNKNYIAGE